MLQPAIQLAEEGFPVSPITAHLWQNGVPSLKRGPYSEEMLFNGRAPKVQQHFWLVF